MKSKTRLRVDEYLGADSSVLLQPLSQRLQSLSSSARKRLLNHARELLQSDEARTESSRVAATKLLLAGLPDSLSHLRGLLGTFETSLSYEVHFSIFCWFDEVKEHPLLSSFVEDITPLAQSYLMIVPNDTAKAAWMAGHFLGDHWDDGSLEALLEVVTGARYAAGRRAALSGIIDRLREARGPLLDKLTEVLRHVKAADRSEEVRAAADLAIRMSSLGPHSAVH